MRAQYDQEFAEHGWEKVPVEYPYTTSAVREGFRVLVETPPDEDDEHFIDLSPE